MTDGKIYIVITDQRPGGNPNTPGPTVINNNGGSEEKEKKDVLGEYAKHHFFSFMKQQFTQAVNYQISNLGNFHGNYQLQRNITALKSDISKLVSIGMAAKAGFMFGGGPVGAIIGASIATVASVINREYENKSIAIENFQTNYRISQLRNRAGLNQLTNGSRGTME